MKIRVNLDLTYEELYLLRRCVNGVIGLSDEDKAYLLYHLDIQHQLEAEGKYLSSKYHIL